MPRRAARPTTAVRARPSGPRPDEKSQARPLEFDGILRGVPRFRFIEPCQPVLRDRPPTGSDWIHEVKFDGYRVQLHKQRDATAVRSRNGFDFTSRYPAIARAQTKVPAKTVILDGELVAS